MQKLAKIYKESKKVQKRRGNCAKYTIGHRKFVKNAHCKNFSNIVK